MVDGRIALGQVIAPLGSNFLVAIQQDLTQVDEPDLLAARLESAAIFAETMDFKVREGAWPLLGWREVPFYIRLPEHKVWVEPPGEYRMQSIDGTVGSVAISPEVALKMRRQKSYAPAFIEAALQGLHGHRPWLTTFDEIAFPPQR